MKVAEVGRGALFLILMVSVLAFAEEKVPGDQEYALDDIVVTASRTETLVKNTPDFIQIVSRKEIEELNPTSTGELLEFVTGVAIETGTGSGLPDRSIISLNGLPAERTLVLVDGVRLLSEHIHTGQNIESIPPQAIERIEIMRGAGSAQYGSDAIGGVVNIITRKAKNKTEMGVHTSVGSYETYESGESFLTPVGDNIRFSHFLHWEKSAGKRIKQPAHRIGNMGYDRINVFNLLDVDLSANTSIYGVWNQVVNNMDWSGSENSSSLLTQILGGTHAINENLDFAGHLAYSKWVANRSSERNELIEPRAYFTWRGWDNHTVIVGVDHKTHKFSRSGVVEHDQASYGLFLQDDWVLNDKTILTGALRFDKVDGINMAISPKLSALYRMNDIYTLRASVGRSFHAPTVQELYEEGYGHGESAVKRYGNPDLDPEYATNYSLGLEARPDDSLFVSCNTFYTDLDDMIVPVYEGNIDPKHEVWRRMNISNAEVYGVETNVKWKMTENLRLDLGYTYTGNENKNTGRQLPYSPGSAAFAKLVNNSKLSDNFKLQCFVGARTEFNREAWSWKPEAETDPGNANGLTTKLDDYVDVIAGVSCFLDDNIELYVRAANLLGEDIENLDDSHMILDGKPVFTVGLNYTMTF